ncbi:MAG: class I SAM-dependent methyltransferase, partial [Myxococcota bacterium]
PPPCVLVVVVGGGVVPALAKELRGRAVAEITCVDEDRDALAAVEAAVGKSHPGLRLRLVQGELVPLCLGASKLRFAPQHVVVLDGLLEYLPERVASSLLRWARGALAPGGECVATSLLPATDEPVFRHLLSWGLVRRTRAATVRLLEGAGFAEVRAYEAAGTGLVAVGR